MSQNSVPQWSWANAKSTNLRKEEAPKDPHHKPPTNAQILDQSSSEDKMRSDNPPERNPQPMHHNWAQRYQGAP
jgi:hypothetical protein